MPALIDYFRELARRLYEHELPQVAGTNTSTDAATLTDLLGNLNYSSGDVNLYDGIYVQLVNQTDDVDNGVGRVTRGGWAVTGSLTVDPSFSVTPAIVCDLHGLRPVVDNRCLGGDGGVGLGVVPVQAAALHVVVIVSDNVQRQRKERLSVGVP